MWSEMPAQKRTPKAILWLEISNVIMLVVAVADGARIAAVALTATLCCLGMLYGGWRSLLQSGLRVPHPCRPLLATGWGCCFY